MTKNKNILLLFDSPQEPSENADELRTLVLKDMDYQDERDVLVALEAEGYNVDLMGIYNNLEQVISSIKSKNYQLVFCMCETYLNQRGLAANIVSVFEMLGVKYTGANSAALQLCSDKALSKKILSYHDILVPNFLVSRHKKPLKKIKELKYPIIVKPLRLEASEGISACSIVQNEKDALERASYVHKKYHVDVIFEEYIEGRELYVGIIGNHKPRVFPPQELKFKSPAKSTVKIASYKVKWDKKYREDYGIENEEADPIDSKTLQDLNRISKKIYQLFHITGYARIDFRLSNDGQIYFLEANPNPAINKVDDFALSAKQDGVEYEDLIHQIVKLGMAA